MYKKITIIFVLFLSVFLFKFNVYAECSYKERKELSPVIAVKVTYALISIKQ